jgi:hypothetical protein
MSNEWVLVILLTAIIALGGFAKVFIVAFVESKAKDLATKKDFEKVVDETRRLTSETEQIKSRITYDLWDRQARFQMTRDLCVRILEATSDVGRYATMPKEVMSEDEVEKWRRQAESAANELNRATPVAQVVLSIDTVLLLGQLQKSTRDLLASVGTESFEERGKEFYKSVTKFAFSARGELGIPWVSNSLMEASGATRGSSGEQNC